MSLQPPGFEKADKQPAAVLGFDSSTLPTQLGNSACLADAWFACEHDLVGANVWTDLEWNCRHLKQPWNDAGKCTVNVIIHTS